MHEISVYYLIVHFNVLWLYVIYGYGKYVKYKRNQPNLISSESNFKTSNFLCLICFKFSYHDDLTLSSLILIV